MPSSSVTEDEIVAAMRLLWERLKLVVEPSGAVAAAPALFRQIDGEGKKIGIVLSGGNVDLNTLPFAASCETSVHGHGEVAPYGSLRRWLPVTVTRACAGGSGRRGVHRKHVA